MYGDGIKNALIKKTSLGDEDRGMMFWLFLEYGGLSQGFGGYSLDDAPEPGDKTYTRTPHKFGIHCIMEILRVVGVSRWEDLPGKYVRAEVKNGLIVAITNILDDELRFCPGELFDKYYAPKDKVK